MSIAFIIFLTFLFMKSITTGKLSSVEPSNRIVVGFSNRQPFVYTNTKGKLQGLDVLVIQNFARKFNFTINYIEYNISLNDISNIEQIFKEYIHRDDLRLVELQQNWRCIRKILFFFKRIIDVLIGALDETLITSEYFTASRSYYHDTLTFCVQTKQPIPMHENLGYACKDVKVWLIFTVMCFCVVFTGYYMQQFEDEPKFDWFRISLAGFGPCFGVVTDYNAKATPHRIAYLFCLLGAFLIYIIGSSFWILFTTNPIFENQISSVQEIINGGLELVGDRFSLQHLINQNQVYPSFI